MAATQFEIENAFMAGRAYFDTRASINPKTKGVSFEFHFEDQSCPVAHALN